LTTVTRERCRTRLGITATPIVDCVDALIDFAEAAGWGALRSTAPALTSASAGSVRRFLRLSRAESDV
jgi:hypothetical protein